MIQWLEIIVVVFASLIIPFIIWGITQFKQSIMAQVGLIITEHYDGLDDQIKYNRIELSKLKEKLKHRAELAYIKYTAIELTIEEIEAYLEKTNGYRRRNRITHINKCNLLIENEEDCDDDSNDLFIGF